LSAIDGIRLNPRRPQWKSPNLAAEEQPADEAEHRGCRGTCAAGAWPLGRDAAGEPVAHHQVRALAQFVNERIKEVKS